MTLTLPTSIESVRSRSSVFRYAVLWRIQRQDGVVLRFTDHGTPITFGDDLYSPVGGVDATAREAHDGLRERNLELLGIINSDDITQDDLRAGKYRKALITERLVDWKYPWLGSWRTRAYWVTDLEFSHQGWKAQVEGVTAVLRRPFGELVTRTCRHNLGDSKCTVNIAAHVDSGTVTAVDSQDRVRMYDDATGQADFYYNNGICTFTSGNNQGLSRPIQLFRDSDGLFQFTHAFPYDIEVGDTYNATPGCGKTKEDCKGVSGTGGKPWANNILNYGGFLFVPGNDKMIQTPDAK
jgi:uncharacterized phage protein (TIGR02218 family)